MPKRLHELLIHSFIRATETILVCDSGTCVVEHSIHIGAVLQLDISELPCSPNPVKN